MKNNVRVPNYKNIPQTIDRGTKLRPSSSNSSKAKSRNLSETKDSTKLFRTMKTEDNNFKKYDPRLRNRSQDLTHQRISIFKKEPNVKGMRRYYEKYSDFMKNSLKQNKDSIVLIGSQRFGKTSVDDFLKEKEKVYNHFNPKFDKDVEDLMKIIENKEGLNAKDAKKKFMEKKWEIMNQIEMTPLPISADMSGDNLELLNQIERSGVVMRRMEYENTMRKRLIIEKVETKFYQKLKKMERENCNKSKILEEDKHEMAKKIQRVFRNYRFRYILFKALFLSHIRRIQKNWRISKIKKFKNYLKSLRITNPNNFQYLREEFVLQEFIRNLETRQPELEHNSKITNILPSDKNNKKQRDNDIVYPSFPNPRMYDKIVPNPPSSTFDYNEEFSNNLVAHKKLLNGVTMSKKFYSVHSLMKIVFIQRKFKRILQKKIQERKMRKERNKAFAKLPLRHKLQLFLVPVETKIIKHYKLVYFGFLFNNLMKIKQFFLHDMNMSKSNSTHNNFINNSHEIFYRKKSFQNQLSPVYMMKLQGFFNRVYQKISRKYNNSLQEIFSVDVFSKLIKFKLLDMLDRMINNKLIEKCFYKLLNNGVVHRNEIQRAKILANNLRDYNKLRDSRENFHNINNNNNIIKNNQHTQNFDNEKIPYFNLPDDHTLTQENKQSNMNKYSTARFRSHCNNLICRNEIMTFSEYSKY